MTVFTRRHFIALSLVGFSLLSGCSSAPVQEMSDARQAIEAAKQGGTNPDLHEAESLLKQAQLALEAGNYTVAKEKANAARIAALHAQQEVESSSDLR
jgi:hypothetical protein